MLWVGKMREAARAASCNQLPLLFPSSNFLDSIASVLQRMIPEEAYYEGGSNSLRENRKLPFSEQNFCTAESSAAPLGLVGSASWQAVTGAQ